MRTLRAWVARLLGSWRGARRERELAEEIESHLQMHVDDNLRAGMAPEAARRAAVLRLGGVEATKEAWRERAGFPLLEHGLQDLRFGLRQLARNPAFAATAVVVLALGTGASAAIFAFVDAALVRPLPYREPSSLVSVAESVGTPARRTPLSHADYLDWRKASRTLESLDAFAGGGYMLSAAGGTELVAGARVSGGFFRTLGAAPALGRDFLPGEDAPGSADTVILSDSAWRRWFGGAGDVVGRVATLSGVPHTVVGVLPVSFHFAPAGSAEFWTTLRGASPCELRRSCHNLGGVGRLKDGVPAAAADAEMGAIAGELERLYPDSNRGQGASVIPLSEEIVGPVRPMLLLLLGGAVLLLVISTVNVASLLLVRSESRRREIAVRAAMGASRGRLARQFLAEGLVLVVAGSGLGLVLAAWAMRLLVGLLPRDVADRTPYLRGLAVDAHVLAFTGVVSLAALMLFCLVPIARSPLAQLREGLAQGGRGSAGTVWRRFASHLVVVELAVAAVLLVGAGLLGRSLSRLLDVGLAFDPSHLVTLTVEAPPSRYAHPQQVALARDVVARAAGIPGVESAAVTSLLPVSFNGNTDWIRFVGRPYGGEHNEVNQRDVSAEYFRTLGARLVRGRFFSDEEDASKPRVVVINRALARRYFPDEDPIGQRFGDTSLSPGSIKEIVGIVDDIREGALDSEIWPAVYYPFNQSPDTGFSLVVRSAPAEGALLQALRAEIRRIDPGLGMRDDATMAGRIADSPSAYLHRSSAWLIGGFAALALLLGTVGLYGVIAYSVGQRSREIGLRMALGARRATVYRMVLGEAGRLAALGIASGLAVAAAVATLMRSLLFETSPWDLPTILGVGTTLAVLALLASYLPARRAASVDPIVALRAE